jgi:nucleoid-associated protein YejK
MQPSKFLKIRKTGSRKRNRELLLTVSVFLLNQEVLRRQFWTVKSVHYDQVNQQIKIGINTTNGKLGTTLAKLRKTSKDLSDYLYDQGVTFRKAKITFFVDKQDVELERIYSLLHSVEKSKV